MKTKKGRTSCKEKSRSTGKIGNGKNEGFENGEKPEGRREGEVPRMMDAALPVRDLRRPPLHPR
jgi:hypothetical protein